MNLSHFSVRLKDFIIFSHAEKLSGYPLAFSCHIQTLTEGFFFEIRRSLISNEKMISVETENLEKNCENIQGIYQQTFTFSIQDKNH